MKLPLSPYTTRRGFLSLAAASAALAAVARLPATGSRLADALMDSLGN